MVGTSGVEPPTTTMSRWCSTAELRAYNLFLEPIDNSQHLDKIEELSAALKANGRNYNEARWLMQLFLRILLQPEPPPISKSAQGRYYAHVNQRY